MARRSATPMQLYKLNRNGRLLLLPDHQGDVEEIGYPEACAAVGMVVDRLASTVDGGSSGATDGGASDGASDGGLSDGTTEAHEA